MDRQYRSIIDGTISRWTRWFKLKQWHTLWYDTKSLQNGVEYSTSTTGLAYDKNIDRNKESWPGLCRDIGPHCSHMNHGEQRRAKAGQTPLTQCRFSIPLDWTPVKWILQVWGASPIIRSNFIFPENYPIFPLKNAVLFHYIYIIYIFQAGFHSI